MVSRSKGKVKKEEGWTPMKLVNAMDDLIYRYSQALYFGKKDLMEGIIRDTRDFLERT